MPKIVVRSSLLAVLALMLGFGCSDGSGGGFGGPVNTCFAQCTDGSLSCTSFNGLDAKECDSIASQDCAGAVMAVEFQEGCECPGFDEPGECTSPPPWAI